MEPIIIAFLVILNVFSIILNWKMLKGYENFKKIRWILIGETVMFIIVNIIYALTSKGIPQEIHQSSKKWIIWTFLGINMIMIYSNLVRQINRKTLDEIDEKTFKEKIIICLVVAVILIIIECIYMKNIQLGILNMKN